MRSARRTAWTQCKTLTTTKTRNWTAFADAPPIVNLPDELKDEVILLINS